jgi:hypothetical protein
MQKLWDAATIRIHNLYVVYRREARLAAAVIVLLAVLIALLGCSGAQVVDLHPLPCQLSVATAQGPRCLYTGNAGE